MSPDSGVERIARRRLREHSQEAILRLLRYTRAGRRRAIAAYWACYRDLKGERPGAKRLEEIFGSRLWGLSGSMLLKLDAADGKLGISARPSRLHAVLGGALEIPVFVRNRGRRSVEITASAAGGRQWRLHVPASGARAFFLEALGIEGQDRLALRFETARGAASIRLPLAVHKTGRLWLSIEDESGRPLGGRARSRWFEDSSTGRHSSAP